MKAVRTLKTQAGFSLIELMIVVAIIGILASIAVPNFQKFQRRAKQSEGKGYLAAIYTGEKGFAAEWNVYTSSMPGIGFTIDAASRGCYSAGINAAVLAVTGNNSIVATGSAIGTTVMQPGVAGNDCTRGSLANVGGVYTNTTFTAGAAAATLYTGGAVDSWTINDAKALTQATSGI